MTTKKFDYKWVILAVCFSMIFVCLGFCSSNKGIYLTAITEAVGIPRGLFSINDSFRYVSMAVINLFFGVFLSRFGIRPMVAFGFITTIASTLIYAYAQDITTFCVGIGGAFTSTNMASTIMRRWFHKDIGKYSGIVFAANGIGATVASLIATPLIHEPGNPFGYRNSYLVVAAIVLITGILAVVLLKQTPPQPTPTEKSKNVVFHCAGIPFSQANRHWPFYMTGIVVFITGVSLQGLSGAFAAHLEDVGITPSLIAIIVSVYSITLTLSKIFSGWLYDRKGLYVVMTVCQIAAITAFIALSFASTSPFGLLLSVAFAVLYSISLPLITLLIPLLVNDFFGAISYDKILGIYAAINYAGYALGAPLVNGCFDLCGSYTPIFLLFAALMLVTIIVFRFARRANELLKINANKEN